MSIRQMDPNQILAWGQLLGLLLKHRGEVDVQIFVNDDGRYEDYMDLRFVGSTTTIRIRVDHDDPDKAIADDLVNLLDEVRPRNVGS